MADLKISALNALSGSDLVAADVVAVVDDSASETKKLTVSDLIANGTTLIADNTIPSAKILFAAGEIDTAELAASAVETAKINDAAVTAAKLANNSSVTLVSTLPASGDFIGQIALDTDDNKIYIWDGSAWDSVKGAGSINVVNGSTTGEVNIVASTSGDTVTISATLDDTTSAAQFLAGPTGSGGTVGYRAIIGTDLPTATTSAKGGVIVNGNGLAMSGDTLTINNTVTAETSEHHIVQYDANGLITAGKAIAGADVPVATSSAVGVVRPGTGLGVDGTGDLNHSNSVSSGTGTKVTFDAQGHITATASLNASDVPDLDAAKITTGTFPAARIGSDAVTGAKLADYTVAQISETTPTADFTSQFFFNPITRDLFLWDGNVFQPVGISAGEIVLAGTYDASTNLLDSVTADGTAAGYTNGAALPAAATGNNRHYVVVSQSGTGTAPAPTVTLEPPDIILSNGTSYVLIETSETITAQIASNVGFTPTGNIAGTNVQAALSEVDSEKLAKGGDTMTGNLNLGEDIVLTFEGATSNDFETTLTVIDPTADRTLSLPNATGTLVSTGDTGSVTSAMIADGTIVNADISGSAEIAVSKLANGTARQLLQTDSAGTGVEFASNIDVPGTLDVTGAATLDSTLDATGLISANGKISVPLGTASLPGLYGGTDTNTGLYFPAANEIAITTGGAQRVVVDSNGNVGVGTAPGNEQLRVQQSAVSSAPSRSSALYLENNGNCEIQFVGNSSNDCQLRFGTSSNSFKGAVEYELDNNNLKFYTDGAEKARITSGGNLGIGTTAPSNPITILDDTQYKGIQLKNSSTTNLLLGGYTSANKNGFIQFYKEDGSVGALLKAENNSYLAGGNFGLGHNNPSVLFHVKGTVNNPIMFETSTDRSQVRFKNNSDDGVFIGSLGGDFRILTNTTERVRVTAAGAVTVTNDATINGLTVGRGNNNVSTNTAVGAGVLAANTTGGVNTAVGAAALAANTEGDYNSAIGRYALTTNTTGNKNTAVGYGAIKDGTTGEENTAVGYNAGENITTGEDNIAIGSDAMSTPATGSTTASKCVAIGRKALYANQSGDNNVAIGNLALEDSFTGFNNVAIGSSAMVQHQNGQANVAIGVSALRSTLSSTGSVAIGYRAAYNSIKSKTVAIGYQALYNATSGVNPSVAVGDEALYEETTGGFNTAIGQDAISSCTTGTYNVGLGKRALDDLTTGSGNIGIGFINASGTYAPIASVGTSDNVIALGHTAVTNAYVQVAWTVVSDQRDKMNFAPVPHGLDFVKQLQPTTFQFKVDRETCEPNGGWHYGFKAQDILELEGENPVIIDADDPDRLKYKGEHLVPVLVNAIQELSATVDELKNELAALKGD